LTMTPRLRKFALTVHITASVGWLDSVGAFLALAIFGLISPDMRTTRAVFLVMEPAGWAILVPFAFASLITGLIQSLGTSWGLVRHHWVLIKLVINIFGNTILLLYMRVLGRLADVAAGMMSSSADRGALSGPSPVLHSVSALLLLIAATALSVYKPKGMTSYGRRKQHEERSTSQRRRHVGRPTPVV
jgi:hypothetical protein